MHELVLVAACRFDEPVALCRIEPFDGALLHRLSPQLALCQMKTQNAQPVRRVQAPRSAPQARFWGGRSETIVSPRHHRPAGQNPIASQGGRINTARAWL